MRDIVKISTGSWRSLDQADEEVIATLITLSCKYEVQKRDFDATKAVLRSNGERSVKVRVHTESCR